MATIRLTEACALLGDRLDGAIKGVKHALSKRRGIDGGVDGQGSGIHRLEGYSDPVVSSDVLDTNLNVNGFGGSKKADAVELGRIGDTEVGGQAVLGRQL